MNKDQIDISNGLIIQYNNEKDTNTKNQLRNRVFMIIKPFMERWIIAILSKKGVYISETEATSKGWDCFEFCLKNYKIGKAIPLPNHFYAYTKFYLAMTFKKELRLKKKEMTELSEIANHQRGVYGNGGIIEKRGNRETKEEILDIEDSFTDVYEHIEELAKFKNKLSPEYVIVFEDALLSMAPNNSHKLQRVNESQLGYAKYHEIKKLMKIVIEFLLTRES